MIIYSFDEKSAEALTNWVKNPENMRFAKDAPCFHKKVRMDMATKPCPMTSYVEKTGKDALIFRVKAEQLSFWEDNKWLIKNIPMGSAEEEFAKLQKKQMRGIDVFKKRTYLKFNYKAQMNQDKWQVKLLKQSTLKEYYGFDPRIAFDALMMGIPNNEENYQMFVRDTEDSLKDEVKKLSQLITELYFAANAYLFYANKDGGENKLINAVTSRSDDGDKLIAFRVLDETDDIYAVETIAETRDSKNKIVPVRGYLKKLTSDRWNAETRGKVIWIDSFVRGLGEEYYKDKRKTKEKKSDALMENPAEWITDVEDSNGRFSISKPKKEEK